MGVLTLLPPTASVRRPRERTSVQLSSDSCSYRGRPHRSRVGMGYPL
jgi:hypothetical protein